MSESPSPSLSSHRPSLASRGHSAPGAVQVRSFSVSAAQTSPPDSSTRYSRSRANSTRSPPSYARSYLDRSPSASAFRPDDRPRVPPPIYLRSSSSQGTSKQGQLKIHIPAWGAVFVRPPRPGESHPLDDGTQTREPPTNDTLLSGSLEVIMEKRRRCHSISIGVQSVCRLHMGKRGWEDDGVFERGVEILDGDTEEIWLEKGSQTFTFSILLPATLAAHDQHRYGRLSYILTARVEGFPDPSRARLGSMFRRFDGNVLGDDIPFKHDFEVVIARSDKYAEDLAAGRISPSFGPVIPSPAHSPNIPALSLGESPVDDSAISIGEGSPSLLGLYHRRQPSFGSSMRDQSRTSSPRPETRSLSSFGSIKSYASDKSRNEKEGWLKGDLHASRPLIVHANPSSVGGAVTLDEKREGIVDGLGFWRFNVFADVFTVSGVMLYSFIAPDPSPDVSIFFIRLLLVQDYKLISPRTPNDPPHQPESPIEHVLYKAGKRPSADIKSPGRNVPALWRAGRAEEGGEEGELGGFKSKSLVRLPGHQIIRPSTIKGSMTPIRVSHNLVLQVFYSIAGKSVKGEPVKGPGDLRAMVLKVPIIVPSCLCTPNALDLPSYERAPCGSAANIDAILASEPPLNHCQCGYTFAELGEAALARRQAREAVEMEDAVQRNGLRMYLDGQEEERQNERGRAKVEMDRTPSCGSMGSRS